MSVKKEIMTKEIAIRLCDEIREKNQRKLFTQCWGCVKFSKGDQFKFCMASKPDYSGCNLVNAKYARLTM